MKRLLLLLILFSPNVLAQETWIQVANNSWHDAKKGSFGYQKCIQERKWCGFGYFVDVKSIVKKTDFVYFNFDSKPINYNLIPDDRVFEGTGWIVDCRKKLMGTNPQKMRKASGDTENQLIEFVCE